eukprot:4284901-Pyramimonas_sp.AAC.1
MLAEGRGGGVSERARDQRTDQMRWGGCGCGGYVLFRGSAFVSQPCRGQGSCVSGRFRAWIVRGALSS